jgi:hypothetical protein
MQVNLYYVGTMSSEFWDFDIAEYKYARPHLNIGVPERQPKQTHNFAFALAQIALLTQADRCTQRRQSRQGKAKAKSLRSLGLCVR